MPGFDPDQPRDEKGQWTSGSDSGIKAAASDKKKYIVGHYTGVVMEEVSGKSVGFIFDMDEEAKKKYGVDNYEQDKFGTWNIKGEADPVLEAEEKINKFKDSLTEDHKYYIANYTNSDYSDINSYLRKGYNDEPDSDGGPYKQALKYLDDFLMKAPKYGGVSYRGLRFHNQNGYESFKKDVFDDNMIMDLAYGSTTIDKSIIKTFHASDANASNVEMTIRGKSGVYLGGLSSFSNEKEVLYPRNTKFKVVSAEESDRVEKNLTGQPRGKFLKITLEEI